MKKFSWWEIDGGQWEIDGAQWEKDGGWWEIDGNPSERSTEELGRKVRRKMPFNSHNPSSLYYPSGYHVHW